MLFAKNSHAPVDKLDTLIGKDTSFEGSIKVKGTLRIDGGVEGEVLSEGDVIIGESGRVTANVSARNVVVFGIVAGNINADSRVELSGTGKITGDIKTSKFIIDEGAVYDGKCSMVIPNEAKIKK